MAGYLYKESLATPQSKPGYKSNCVTVVGRKKKCGHAWCPRCGLDTIRKALASVRQMDWRRVRRVDFTLDPSLFKNPQEAHKLSERKLSDTIQAIERKAGREVLGYRWFKEWHRDGFPHWHVLIEMAGPSKMIGGDVLREVWGQGRVYEDYFKDENQWVKFVGYLGKTGYLAKDKAHQVRLPQWVLDTNARVRRTGGSEKPEAKEKPWADDEDVEDWLKRFGHQAPEEHNQIRSHGEILATCGGGVHLYILQGKAELIYYGLSKEKYEDFKSREGEFLKGLGFAIKMEPQEWVKFYHSTIPSDPDQLFQNQIRGQPGAKPKPKTPLPSPPEGETLQISPS